VISKSQQKNHNEHIHDVQIYIALYIIYYMNLYCIICILYIIWSSENGNKICLHLLLM